MGTLLNDNKMFFRGIYKLKILFNRYNGRVHIVLAYNKPKRHFQYGNIFK